MLKMCVEHIALSVSNMKKSVDFYSKFGFRVVNNYSDANVEITRMEMGSIDLELFCYKNYDALPLHAQDLAIDLKTLGTKHFGIGVNTLEEAIAFLLKNNIINQRPNINKGRLGKNYFFISDPDGILVEIIER